MSTKIRPLHDRVIVKRAEDEHTSAGGIVIPDSAKEKKPPFSISNLMYGSRRNHRQRLSQINIKTSLSRLY